MVLLKSTQSISKSENRWIQSYKEPSNIKNSDIYAIFMRPRKIDPPIGPIKKVQKMLTYKQIINLNSWLEYLSKGYIYNYAHGYEVYHHDSSSEYYNHDIYHIINKDDFEIITEKLIEIYRDKLGIGDKKLWYNTPPNIDYKNDPIFVLHKKIADDNSHIILIGDLHSSITSLLSILLQNKKSFSDFEKYKLKNDTYMIFLGDIVDRGPYGIEMLVIVSLLKINNKDRVFIINGNHEDRETYNRYGLETEAGKQFNGYMLRTFEFMHYFPSVIFLEYDGVRYQLCHGAITIEESIKKKIKSFLKTDKKYLFLGYQIKDEKQQNIIDSYKWGDFTNRNNTYNSPRGGDICVYGKKDITEYLDYLKIISVISGHQDNSNLTFCYQYIR